LSVLGLLSGLLGCWKGLLSDAYRDQTVRVTTVQTEKQKPNKQKTVQGFTRTLVSRLQTFLATRRQTKDWRTELTGLIGERCRLHTYTHTYTGVCCRLETYPLTYGVKV
jgi:hypothetical protein